MQTPRVSALTDCENRLRRDWLAFVEVWQRTAEVWRDHRRRQFEDEHLREVPPAFFSERCLDADRND